MKAGYIIEYEIDRDSRYFVLTNYPISNEIVYYGYASKLDVEKEKDIFFIGLWKIKKLKA